MLRVLNAVMAMLVFAIISCSGSSSHSTVTSSPTITVHFLKPASYILNGDSTNYWNSVYVYATNVGGSLITNDVPGSVLSPDALGSSWYSVTLPGSILQEVVFSDGNNEGTSSSPYYPESITRSDICGETWIVGQQCFSSLSAAQASMTSTETGSFKIVNQWGTSASCPGSYNGGFNYITYDAAFLNIIQSIDDYGPYAYFWDMTFTEYNPQYLVVFSFSGNTIPADLLTIEVGLGAPAAPVIKKTFLQNYVQTTSSTYPNNQNLVMDISEFGQANITSNNLYIKLTNNSSGTGNLSNFNVEYYSSTYVPNNPTCTISSTNLPVTLPVSGSVTATIVTSGQTAKLGNAKIARLSALQQRSKLFVSRPLMDEDLLKIKKNIPDPVLHQNKIINGHGTGGHPLSSMELKKLVGKAKIITGLTAEGKALASSSGMIDLSASSSFPKVGDQGQLGSCGTFSVGYYSKTFREALKRGWTYTWMNPWNIYSPKAGVSPISGTAAQLATVFSPLFIFSQVNGGTLSGTYSSDCMQIMLDFGCASFATLPYDGTYEGSSVTAFQFPSEAAYREAVQYRDVPVIPTNNAESMNLILVAGQTKAEFIQVIRTLISSNIPVSFCFNANNYNLEDSYFYFTAAQPMGYSTNHVNTIVGYNDNSNGIW